MKVPGRYEPSDGPMPREILRRLDFLTGTFRGEGTFAGRRVVFDKRLEGTWEAGGHFLALRMAARYRVGEKVTDEHGALVVVGAAREGAAFEADAYTDSGDRLRYAIEVDSARIVFDDRVPHETRARRARKVLTPTDWGYDEILEIAHDAGAFEAYSRVAMHRED